MNRIKILSILLLLPLFWSQAKEDLVREQPIDPKAKSMLDKAVASFDSKSGMAADFVITLENLRDSKKESFNGNLMLKGEMFKLNVNKVETYFDGTTQYVYMQDVNEVTISSPSKEDMKDINPLLLMKSYQEGYKMKYFGQLKENGKILEIIELYPNDLKSEYSIIRISLEKDSLKFYSIRLQGKNGVNTLFKITKMESKNIADSAFSLDYKNKKNIEVIDLR